MNTSINSETAVSTTEEYDVDIDPTRYKRYKTSWRLNQLSQQVPRLKNDKYEPPPYNLNSNVPSSALRVECSMRQDHLSRPGIRLLEVNKRLFDFKGDRYVKRMNKKIEESWNSIYNYYKLQAKDIETKKKKKIGLLSGTSTLSAKSSKKSLISKGSKKSKISKRSREDELKELEEWCAYRAMPKVPPPQPKIDRGKRIEDLYILKDRLTQFSSPKYTVPKYDPEDAHWKDAIPKVREAALSYVPTERIMTLAKPYAYKVYQKPLEEPSVNPSALEYNATERMQSLAQPKKRSKGPESDVREDAFIISKGALKYVATPRILELAKPIER